MRVYISSTSMDLREYRLRAVDVALRHRYHPLAMEHYVAEDTPPVERCLEDVASCNLYVGIFAWRYGFVPEGCQASITELEYRTAIDKRIPTLLFLLDEAAPWPEEYRDTGPAEGEIRRLRADMQAGQVVSFFRTPDDFALALSTALAGARRSDGSRVVGLVPDVRGFRNRESSCEALRETLREDGAKLVSVIGRGGVGKTWVLAKLAQEVQDNRLCLTEAASEIGADGLIYMSCEPDGTPPMERLFRCVGQVLGSPHEAELDDYWRQALPIADKTAFLLGKLRDGCYLLFLDGLDALLDGEGEITDHDLRAFVRACLTTRHALRLIASSRRPLTHGGWAGEVASRAELALQDGLPEADAVALLRESGPDPRLREATQEDLRHLAQRCGYMPRALHTVVNTLQEHPTWTLARPRHAPARPRPSPHPSHPCHPHGNLSPR